MEQPIDYRALQFWLSVSQAVGYVILGLYVWLSNRRKATRSEIKEVRAKMESMQAAQASGCGRHQARTTKLEEAVKNAPTHSDIGAVYEKVNGVKSSVDEMSGVLKGVNTQVNLLVKHHMNGGS